MAKLFVERKAVMIWDGVGQFIAADHLVIESRIWVGFPMGIESQITFPFPIVGIVRRILYLFPQSLT